MKKKGVEGLQSFLHEQCMGGGQMCQSWSGVTISEASGAEAAPNNGCNKKRSLKKDCTDYKCIF